jgi:precorrin-6A/cobalt-precorrin-6A reductase
MILVLGGTTEGRKLTQRLDAAHILHIYSTQRVTRLESSRYRHYRSGALDNRTLSELCREHGVNLIVDASHPFAAVLHQLLAHTSTYLQLPLWRLERPFDPRRDHPLVHYIHSYEEALKLLHEQQRNRLLALTGVGSIPKLEPFWRQRTCFLRVLDRPSSRELVIKHSFPLEHTIFSSPAERIEEEVAAWRPMQVQAVLCKESGRSGFLHVKIAAALELGIPIFILCRPPLPQYDHIFTDVDALMEELSMLSALWG